jgi:isopentenyl diphosphate isomerase/L-lactate dehydrogenase-like FMN-dependent dehydrogenase
MTDSVPTGEFATLQDVVMRARCVMQKPVWDFVVGASESETTVKRNRAALDRWAFEAEPFNDVSRINLSTQLLGHTLATPIVLAPMGSVALLDPDGALAAARAAAEVGTLTFVSGIADPGIDVVSAATDGPLVYTLYVTGDQRWLDETLAHVASLPVAAIALLADAPYYGRRDRDLMNAVKSKVSRKRHYADVMRLLGSGEIAAPENEDPSFYGAKVTWEMFEYIKTRTGLPLVVKGVMSARTAVRAVEHGADVLYVSNHGGRQLDHQLGTVDVLPEVVDAVGSKVEVVVDGGCLRGADVAKCLALGAKAVGIGRLQALALAAGGSAALVRTLRLLEEELLVDMGLLGVTTVHELRSTRLISADVTGPNHVLGPYAVVMEQLGRSVDTDT